MPVYNGREYIATTLQHLLDHQFATMPGGEWELIVVDDGSTDGTPEIIERFGHASIRLIKQPNSGAAKARNRGLQAATGDFVYFMDSDDLLTEGALPLLLGVGRSNGADIVKFCLQLISSDQYREMVGRVPATEAVEADFKPYSPTEFLDLTVGMTTPTTDCTVLALYRRGFLIENSLGFNESMLIGEDVDLAWKSMFCNPRIFYAPARLYLYHQRRGSVSHDPARQEEIISGQLDYLLHMLDIRREVGQKLPESTGALTGLNNTVRFYTNLVQANKVIIGASYREILTTMSTIMKHGGDIHPGRPRFNGHITLPITPSARRRRWVSAYPLALIVKLFGK